MVCLVLNRRRILSRLKDWIPNSKENVIVFTARSALADSDARDLASHFRHFEVIDAYDGPDADTRIVELCKLFPVRRIITTAEVDVIRAAAIRQKLNIPGQSVESATSYRDKYVMKSLVSKAGVPTAPMMVVDKSACLHDFADMHGYPIVIKRLRGAGSVGMRVLEDESELHSFVAGCELTCKTPGLLAEAWITGSPYQVNGLMRDGRIIQSWPTRALYSDWAMIDEFRPGVTGMIPESHHLFDALQQMAAAVIGSLPPCSDTLPFHAEFFHTSNDQLILCEIACRAGGGKIVEMHEKAFGLNLYEATVKSQGCDDYNPPSAGLLGRYGFASFTPRPGILRRLPEKCTLPSAIEYWRYGIEGKRYEGADSMGVTVAQLLFSLSSLHVEHELRIVECWWQSESAWVEAPSSEAI
jgi:biotin carboxylase